MSIEINELKYYVQKALPAVYDDSLSYYELLSKVLVKVNEVIKGVNKYFSEDIEVHVERILIEWREMARLTISFREPCSKTLHLDWKRKKQQAWIIISR